MRNIDAEELLYHRFQQVFSKTDLNEYLNLFNHKSEKPQESFPYFSLVGLKKHGGMELGLKMSALLCEEVAKLSSHFGIIQRLLALDLIPLTDTSFNPALAQDIFSGKVAAYALYSEDFTPNKKISFLAEGQATNSHCIIVVLCKRKEGYRVTLLNENEIKRTPYNRYDFTVYGYDLPEINFLDDAVLISLQDERIKQLRSKQFIYHAAYLLGLGRRAQQLAINYTSSRQQFGKKIIENQYPRLNLAESMSKIEVCQNYYDFTIWAIENKANCYEFLARNTFDFISETVFSILKLTLHLHGAFGLTEQAEIQRLYRLFALQKCVLNKNI